MSSSKQYALSAPLFIPSILDGFNCPELFGDFFIVFLSLLKWTTMNTVNSTTWTPRKSKYSCIL